MIAIRDKEDALDQLAAAFLDRGISVERMIPLLESASFRRFDDGDVLFQQFHPADKCYLLVEGSVKQATASASRTELVHHGVVDWTWAVLGWSGFLSTQRFGSTVVALGSLAVLAWPHETLKRLFYADPKLAARFFDLMLGSVGRQLATLRRRQLVQSGAFHEAPEARPMDTRRPVVGRADSCLRRSAFFAPFDDDVLEALGARAELESYGPGECIARQDESTNGLLLLASGSCDVFFESSDGKLLPFRRFHNRIGILAGTPTGDDNFVAEASVYADSHCWVYRLPAAAIVELSTADPEFGRALKQRLLARMSGLVGALQVEHSDGDADAEVALVMSAIANAQARLPVSSDLFKLPHLLSHRLTVSNALAVLDKVAETGSYHERLLAARCRQALNPVAAENAFYLGIIAAVEAVVRADEERPAEDVRAECDRAVAEAFGYLDCRVIGEDRLPASGGNVFILNHLGCPAYYELPNGYHFSFDTGFVSQIVWRHFGRSALRVIRESPGIEFGHNLFYRRLGHITVPTIESDAASLDEAQFAERRRAAGAAFIEQGTALLKEGHNLIICPEGQSQPVELSPARFHTGAFRLALAAEAKVVPVALAGFNRRYKDGPLVAIIGEPIDVAASMRAAGQDTVREFADDLRAQLAVSVKAAQEIAAESPALSSPDG